MRELLRFLLTAPAEPLAVASLADLWAAQRERAARWSVPFDRAVAGGLAADRLGYAFAAGYDAALRALVPDVPIDHIVSLCATEEGGAQPRAIRTELLRGQEDGRMRLRGKKRWTTLGTEANELLVVASVGMDDAGKNRLRVVRVSARAPGVVLTPMPPTPFAPEIPHAELTLSDVAVDEGSVLPGDGYDDYVKPFRTVEDVHVFGALLGYLTGVARRSGWPEAVIARAAALVACGRALASLDFKAFEVHAAVAGLLDETRALVEETSPLWASAPAEERERWERDRSLLMVAERARTARRERAFQALSAEERR